jgi:multisubunit Na+/H+ antiporter MnhC subunit
MGKQRSAAGASLLALVALAALPVVVFLTTRDLVLAVVGGSVLGSGTAYLILVVARTTRDCPGYLEGAGRVYSGGEAGHAGWGLTALSTLAAVGLVIRIWRSGDPVRSALVLAGLVVATVAGSFVLVVVVMAFGDLVDWLLRKRRG